MNLFKSIKNLFSSKEETLTPLRWSKPVLCEGNLYQIKSPINGEARLVKNTGLVFVYDQMGNVWHGGYDISRNESVSIITTYHNGKIGKREII